MSQIREPWIEIEIARRHGEHRARVLARARTYINEACKRTSTVLNSAIEELQPLSARYIRVRFRVKDQYTTAQW